MRHSRSVLIAGLASYMACSQCGADEKGADSPASQASAVKSTANVAANGLLTKRDFDEFRIGRSFEEIAEAVEWRGNLQMAAVVNQEWLVAVNYGLNGGRFESDGGTDVLGLFRDGKFEKFVNWPTVHPGMRLGEYPLLLPAFAMPPIDSIAEHAKSRRANLADKSRDEKVDGGLTVVVGALSPFLFARQEKDRAINTRLRQQFNALKITRGMSSAEVAALFRDKPLETHSWNAGQIEVFGSRQDLSLLPDLHYSNIVVLYDERGLTVVYSGDWVSGGSLYSQTLRKSIRDFPEE